MKTILRSIAGVLAAVCVVVALPAAAQQDLPNPPDPYVHAGSGAAFPGKIGPWSRTRVTEYQEDGADVSVGYGLRSHPRPVIVTLYVYPRWVSCEEEFAATLDPVSSYIDRTIDVEPGSEQFMPFEGAEQHLGRFSVPPGGYGFEHQRLVTDAWIACPANSDWVVKLRASYEAPQDEALIRQLIARIDWASLAPAQ